MSDGTRWLAPAKLNLFLHITGRRADGYHVLQSVFQFVDYSDELEFDIHPHSDIRRVSDHPGVNAEDDLTVRAAKALQQAAGIRQGVDIRLHKHLPMGGGVGGGSSDAATTLLVLNQLWQAGLSIDQLAHLGLTLGADVPVFVRGHAAFAEGVGEQLQAIDLPEPWYLIVKPPVHVSTAQIFGDAQLTRNCPAIKIHDLQTGALKIEDLTNVCEAVATRHYPVIADVIDYLKPYGNARMTGTGACVFTAFDTETAARQALNELPDQWSGFVAKGCNVSPLHRQLGALKAVGYRL